MTDQTDRDAALDLAEGEEKQYAKDGNLYTIQLVQGQIEIRHGDEAIGPASMTLPASRDGSLLTETTFSLESPFSIVANQKSQVRVFVTKGQQEIS